MTEAAEAQKKQTKKKQEPIEIGHRQNRVSSENGHVDERICRKNRTESAVPLLY